MTDAHIAFITHLVLSFLCVVNVGLVFYLGRRLARMERELHRLRLAEAARNFDVRRFNEWTPPQDYPQRWGLGLDS